MADKFRHKKEPKHIRLYAYVTNSEAWRHASGNAIKVLLALIARDNGAFNGNIGFSCREAAEIANISVRTAWRCLVELQDKGFIVCTEKGGFSRKIQHATTWRYTWVAWPGGKPAAPTHDYRNWKPDGNSRLQSLSGAVAVSAPEMETGPSTVEDIATGQMEKPTVSNDPDFAETTTLTVYQGDRCSPPATATWKQGDPPSDASMSALRAALVEYLHRHEVGEQSRLAARALIPPGTLSKFLHGRPLPAGYHRALADLIGAKGI